MITRELVLTVARRPDLWAESVRTLFAVAPRDWWRKSPYVPMPESDYAEWRLATAHGDPNSKLSPEELLRYLEWRKRQHRVLGRV